MLHFRVTPPVLFPNISVLLFSLLFIHTLWFPTTSLTRTCRSHTPMPFVLISQAGEIRISDGTEDPYPIHKKQLLAVVDSWFEIDPEIREHKRFIIKAEEKTPYAIVQAVTDDLKNAGFDNMIYLSGYLSIFYENEPVRK